MKHDKTSRSNKAFPLRKMGVGLSFSLFGAAALLLVLETSLLIPALSKVTGQEPILFWFTVAGL
ncbi:MAG: hypothetical protein KAI38_02615, partial [Candidatus Latescibacteria bacterium]|nr:hypothetical protein [Candidatus Latescibacterota bacterium]